MNLQELAESARTYCESEQNREFELDGACHENAIGAGDYIRLNTSYNPIIVWGVVSNTDDSADKISQVSEEKTHFWLELENETGIIDVYTVTPITGTDFIEDGIAYGGEKPNCYKTVEKFKYYGQITPYDLCHKDNFARVRSTVEMV